MTDVGRGAAFGDLLDDAGDAYVTALSGFAAPLVEIVAAGRTIDLASDAWVNAQTDGDRIWLGGNATTAVYLKDSAGLRPMASLTSGQIRIAGACRRAFAPTPGGPSARSPWPATRAWAGPGC